MADAALIGANFSDYTGDPALGGGSFGEGKLDVQPIQDYARYIMLYNKAEYDQRQRDIEKAAKEVADLASYDLTTTIPKDSQVLQQKYDALLNYVRDNPDATDYRNKTAWAEYHRRKSELENDIKGATMRRTIYDLREKEIAEELNPERKRLMQQRLDEEVNAKDIRTALLHSQKYDIAMPELPTPTEYKFDVTKTGPNKDAIRDYSMWNVGQARAQGNVYALDLMDDTIDESTPEGRERAIARKGNFFLQGAEQLNAIIKDPVNQVNGKFDPSKLKGISKQLIGLAEKTNEYLDRVKNEINAGVYKDKFGKPINFGSGLLKLEDYDRINYEDGISPDELAVIASYAQWKGDSYKTKEIETDDAIQQAQIATQRRGQDLENNRFWAGLKYKNQQSLLGADSVIREVSDVIKAAIPTTVFDINSKGEKSNEVQRFRIADPNLLREFGTIDKDGNITNVPDKVFLDKKNNTLSLVYLKKDDDGSIQTRRGNDVIERQIPLTATQWMGQIVKRKFPNADIGDVNNLIDQIYESHGRDLQKMIDAYSGGVTINTGSSSSGSVQTGGGSSTKTPSSKWDKYEE